MQEAIIMKWICGSWKSTHCSNLDESRVIASNDTIREMYPKASEEEVHDYLVVIMKWAFKDWKNIVVDNTNMNPKTLKRTKYELNQIGYKDIVILDMVTYFQDEFHYLEESIKRNSQREWYKRVPTSVIYSMRLQEYNTENSGYGNILMVDIDWTIANWSHREHFVSDPANKQRDKYFALLHLDTPIMPVIKMVQTYKLQNPFNKVVILSWRPDTYCMQTEERLQKHNIPYDFLLMRNWRDKRPDHIVKRQIFQKCLEKEQNKIIWVFDDRKQVCDMRREKVWVFVFNCHQWNNNDF